MEEYFITILNLSWKHAASEKFLERLYGTDQRQFFKNSNRQETQQWLSTTDSEILTTSHKKFQEWFIID